MLLNIFLIIFIFILILYILNTKKETYENSIEHKTLSYNEFKNNYTKTNNKVIPKIIFRTGPFKFDQLPDIVKKYFNNLIISNPDYTQVYFDDDDCRNFINEFFPEYLNEYDILIPTAFKADLWRLLVIYKYGGIYNDLGHIYKTPISTIVNHSDELILCVDDKTYGLSCLHNAFFASYPNHPIIKFLIDNIIHHIRTRYVGKDPLSITGPYAWAKIINKLLNRSIDTRFYKGKMIHQNNKITFVEYISLDKSISFGHIINIFNQPCILNKFPNYYKIMYHNRKIPHYSRLYYNNLIYKDSYKIKNVI
jgi:mannosyltransferase OCH1-like enzyme